MTRRRKLNLSVAATLALIYVVVFWGVGCADYLILHPSTEALRDVRSRRATFEAGGKALEMWTAKTRLRETDENQAYVLEFIPNAGRAEYGADYGLSKWEGRAVEYWALNYPGYGGSEGKATLKAIAPSALAAYDELARRAGGKPIFLYGHSLGSAAALYVAAHRPVAGVMVYNPPPLRQLIVGKYGWWNLWLAALPVAMQVPPELDSLANGARCTAPAVFMMGKNDEMVGHPYQTRVFDAYAGPKHRLDLAVSHNDDPEEKHRAEIWGEVTWLWERGVPAPASRPTTMP